jgi:hypothetical protein
MSTNGAHVDTVCARLPCFNNRVAVQVFPSTMLLEYEQMVDQPLNDRYEFADLHTLLGAKMGGDDNDIHRAHKQRLLQYHQDTAASIGLVIIADSCFCVIFIPYLRKRFSQTPIEACRWASVFNMARERLLSWDIDRRRAVANNIVQEQQQVYDEAEKNAFDSLCQMAFKHMTMTYRHVAAAH